MVITSFGGIRKTSFKKSQSIRTINGNSMAGGSKYRSDKLAYKLRIRRGGIAGA
jgi:hypothetical protein